MVTTYPDDAVFNTSIFSVAAETTYTDTGPVRVTFPTSITVDTVADVLVIDNGLLQDPSVYSIAANSAAVTLNAPPNTANLTIKSITVPDRFKKLRDAPIISSASFSNTQPNTINSNVYLINGDQISWAIPEGSSAISKNDLLVTVSGVVQHSINTFVYPSTTLSNDGIDIEPALLANDTLEIRVFDTLRQVTDRCSSMIDKRPDKGYTEERQFDTLKFESQAGYEKRRLRSRRIKRKYNLTYTNITGLEKNAIRDFFDNRFGEHEAFLFDLDHLNQVGIITTRFDGNINIQHVFDGGGDELQKFYTVSINFQEVFD